MLKVFGIQMSTNCGRQISMKSILNADNIMQPFKSKNFSQRFYKTVFKETRLKKKRIKRNTNENDYFHSVLKSKPLYHRYLAYDPVQSTRSVEELQAMMSSNNQDLLDLFRQIGSLPLKQREIFFYDTTLSHLLEDYVKNMLPTLCNEDFIAALKAIGTLELRHIMDTCHIGYHYVIKNMNELIGKQCEARADHLDFNSLMVAADLFFTLHFTYLRLPFYDIFWRRMETEHVTVQSAVPLLFNAAIKRKLSWTMRDTLLKPFHDGAHNLSLNECALISAGFHKSNHPVRSLKFNDDVIQKMINEINTAEDISVCAIFKSLSRTYDKGITDEKHRFFYNSLKSLSSEIGRKFNVYSVMSVVRIMTFYNKSLLMNEKMQRLFILKVKQTDLKSLRLKEISKICFLLGVSRLNFDGIEDFFSTVANEIFQIAKIQQVDDESLLHNIARCITGMIMLDHFPEKLINDCFSLPIHPDEIRPDTRRMLFQVDQSVQIEGPLYKCRLLPHSSYEMFAQELVQPKLSRLKKGKAFSGREKLIVNVMHNLEEILGGTNYFDVVYLFKHFSLPDIVMYFDGKEMVKVNQKMTDLTRVVLCVHADNAFCQVIKEDGTETFSLGGLAHMRQRQLQKIGCTVIPINGYEYNGVEDKTEFLRDQLTKNINVKIK